MNTKTIESVISPAPPHFVGDGFRVHNFIPGVNGLSMQRMDPVIMMDYNSKHYFTPTESPRGVGVHPHRGFETVTIAYKGKIEHHDSSGGGGIISEGDVQWMTAAKGVLHKEFHEREWSKIGGEFQMVQLWINLPAKDKMTTPKYQALDNKNIARYKIDEKSEIEIIAGEYNGIKGSASTFTPLHLLNIKLANNSAAHFSYPSHYNTCMLVIEGSITVNQSEKAPTNHFVLMSNDGENFSITATEDAKILLLSGEPINEPIAAHGPFVMNTKQELVQAFEDYQNGQFGQLD